MITRTGPAIERLEDLLAAAASPRFLVFATAGPAALAVARLRRIKAAAAAGQPLDPDDAAWLAAGLENYLGAACRGATLDQTLEVTALPFAAPWWEQQGLIDRRAALRELSRLLARGSASGTAKAIATAAADYAAGRWPALAARPGPPAEDIGRPEEIFWRLHASGCRWPLAWRQIYDLCNDQH